MKEINATDTSAPKTLDRLKHKELANVCCEDTLKLTSGSPTTFAIKLIRRFQQWLSDGVYVRSQIDQFVTNLLQLLFRFFLK